MQNNKDGEGDGFLLGEVIFSGKFSRINKFSRWFRILRSSSFFYGR